jgi:hypothetical protein
MEDWDSIDWDEKVNQIVKNQQQKLKKTTGTATGEINFIGQDKDYFEENQERKRQIKAKQQIKSSTSKGSKQSDDFVQPYSNKDLRRIRQNSKSPATFHNLIYETFGQFERFLMTHQEDLTQDVIVELLIIDAALLDVPFHAHNQLLLREMSCVQSFWSQLIQFLQEFLSSKHLDMKFCLTVDMNGFFDNIESLMQQLLINNFFNSQMETVFKKIAAVMESFVGNKWSCPERLRSIHEQHERNRDVFRIYDVRNVLFLQFLIDLC